MFPLTLIIEEIMEVPDIDCYLGLKDGKEHTPVLSGIPHFDRRDLSILLGDPDSIALEGGEAFNNDNGHGHNNAVITVVKGMELGQIQEIINMLRPSIFRREGAI